MLFKMFVVYDSKSESYGMPMFLKSRGEALRAFIDAASDCNSMLGKHPGDFTLFEIGDYNQATALINTLNTPVSLGVLIELLAPVS